MSALEIEDEFGVTWHVDKGDPSYEHVQKLRKANYTWVILPRRLILDGVMPEEFSHIGEGCLQRDLRLMECVEVLSGSQ